MFRTTKRAAMAVFAGLAVVAMAASGAQAADEGNGAEDNGIERSITITAPSAVCVGEGFQVSAAASAYQPGGTVRLSINDVEYATQDFDPANFADNESFLTMTVDNTMTAEAEELVLTGTWRRLTDSTTVRVVDCSEPEETPEPEETSEATETTVVVEATSATAVTYTPAYTG